MKNIARNAVWGVGWGCCMAMVYSLVALTLYAIGGSRILHTPGLTIGKVLLSYWFDGIVAGLSIGLARPLLTRRWGLGLVGALAGSVAFIGIETARKGLPTGWSIGDWVAVLVLGGVLGCLAAYDPR